MASLSTLRGPALRRFLWHYIEMVVAMVAGMAILGPVESVLLNPVGWAEVRAVPELRALVMATNMTVAMVAWMCYRQHSWIANAQMAAAMYLPFVAFFPLLWLDLLSATGLMVAGHVLMVPAMTAAMLWRVDEYTGHAHQPVRA
jgi:hypothetical protein